MSLENIYKTPLRFKEVNPTNIWVEITDLSRKYEAIDLAEVYFIYFLQN
jgi:hypothetical protein